MPPLFPVFARTSLEIQRVEHLIWTLLRLAKTNEDSRFNTLWASLKGAMQLILGDTPLKRRMGKRNLTFAAKRLMGALAHCGLKTIEGFEHCVQALLASITICWMAGCSPRKGINEWNGAAIKR